MGADGAGCRHAGRDRGEEGGRPSPRGVVPAGIPRADARRSLLQELGQLQELARLGQLTTAAIRPNAYISEETGIPQPFGTFNPFKPTEPGATMRHIRKPQPKEIVI